MIFGVDSSVWVFYTRATYPTMTILTMNLGRKTRNQWINYMIFGPINMSSKSAFDFCNRLSHFRFSWFYSGKSSRDRETGIIKSFCVRESFTCFESNLFHHSREFSVLPYWPRSCERLKPWTEPRNKQFGNNPSSLSIRYAKLQIFVEYWRSEMGHFKRCAW